ncbi:hypothetical protein VTK73DRAFT_10142 [Phialemonium thermophilum]|uniref:Zn(2)-C6 fungal-type domain-containing protein n=1 Tax=Phialemonium thermophilum TaxID=223376 RepID=A0ABR3VY94_9PEZI
MSSTPGHRACESCRLSKVRCQAVPGASGQCQRCAAAGKECTYTEPRRTKRKRTDVRVGELEQEIKTLASLLRAEKGVEPPPVVPVRPAAVESGFFTPPHGVRPTATAASKTTPVGEPGCLIRLGHLSFPGDAGPKGGRCASDPVEAGVLSMEHAARLFDRYQSQLSVLRPFVVFPPETPAGQLRAARPVLFLAILVASTSTLDKAICDELNELLLQSYAERIIVRGEKSLELVQALLVSTNWHCHAKNFDHLNFHQQLHMAATMAIDLDLGKKPNRPLPTSSLDSSEAARLLLERRRTLVACYNCCSSISLHYHRPNMFPFTSDVEACIEALEQSPWSPPSDSTLTAQARLHHLVDLSEAALGLRGRGSKVDMNDPAFQLSLANCTKQLETWRNETPPQFLNEVLRVQYHSILCLLHQVCLYSDFDVSDFKPPYVINLAATRPPRPRPVLLSPSHLASLTTCMSSAHAVADLFLSLPLTTLVCTPVPVFARMGHAAFVLVKIHIAATVAGGAWNGVVSPDSVRAGYYLDLLVHHLEEVSPHQFRAGYVWYPILYRLREWFTKYCARADGEDDVSGAYDLFEPLRQFPLTSSVDFTVEDETRVSSEVTRSDTDVIREASMLPGVLPAGIEDGDWFQSLTQFPGDLPEGTLSDGLSNGLDGWSNAHAELSGLHSLFTEPVDWPTDK